MLYAIVTRDAENSLELRKQARPDHLKRIEALRKDGRLILAGPFPATDNEEPGDAGFTGSLIVAEFPSLEEATEWANTDPYMETGVTIETTVKPYIKTQP